MPLSWNEIKAQAAAFSKEWEDEASVDAEAKSFWNGFFTVFGVNRRRIASFEAPIKRDDDSGGFMLGAGQDPSGYLPPTPLAA